MPKKLFAVISILFLISVSAFLLTGFLPVSKTIAYGCFHRVAHKGTGCAALVRKSDGQIVLHLTEFRTAKNDDLQILLISANDALENETVKNSQRLFVAPLEKSEGTQVYSVPADENLFKYNSVVIWQSRHGVNFTTAPLKKF